MSTAGGPLTDPPHTLFLTKAPQEDSPFSFLFFFLFLSETKLPLSVEDTPIGVPLPQLLHFIEHCEGS